MAKKKSRPGVEVDCDHIPAHGHHRVGEKRGADQHQRRGEMHDLVGRSGYDVFLGERFQCVRDRLKHAIRTNAIRTIAVLNSCKPFAFKDGSDGEEGGKYDDDGDDGYQHRNRRLQQRRRVDD